MAAFDYKILVTGDCQSNSSGAINITLTGGTPPYVVNWLEPNLNYDNTSSSSTRTGLYHGNYLLQLNDSTLPTNQSFLVTIPVSSGMCVSVSQTTDSTCGNDNGSMTGNTNSYFSYSTFDLYNSSDSYVKSATINTDFFIFDSLSADTYYVVGTDLGGCTGRSEYFIINESTDFDFGIFSVANASCDIVPNGKLYVTGQTGYPPYSYLWSNNSTGNTITGLSEGSYSVTVTDSKNCRLTKSAIVEKVEPVGFGFATPTPPTCFSADGSILFYTTGGTPPFCYSASTGDIETTYSREFILSGLSPGVYSVYTRDSSLCSYTQTVPLLSPNNISSVNIVSENSYCSNSDGQISMSINGGSFPYSYYIVNPTGGTSTYSNSSNSFVFTGLSSGIYTVGVTDSSGCTYYEEIIILTENKFTISASTTGTTCGSNNGKIYVYQSTGGTYPFTYYLDGVGFDTSLTGHTFYNVSSGQHIVGVSDSTGCRQDINVIVSQSAPLDFSLSTTSCGDGNSGQITAFVNSGTPPFAYQWSSNVSGNPQTITASNLSGGTYSLTIVDGNGCSLSRTAIISCPIVYESYETYSVFDQNFEVGFSSKRGMFELLNEGYADLTSGNTGCVLISAIYSAEVSVSPSGFTNSQVFYTGYSRTDIPADNLWYNSIKDLISTIPGIESVELNPITNTIKIISAPSSTNLNGQVIEAKLKIDYDIMCST